MKYKAFLFDLNGTMIDDMPYHIKVWHRLLNDLGADLSLAEVKKECYGSNFELLERVFPGKYPDEEKERISLEKESRYQREFKPFLELLPGLNEFLQKAHENTIKMAIGTAAIQFNVGFVLDNLGIRQLFDVVISAENVTNGKPHPETYLQCAQLLSVAPENCLVFEDTPKGVESALRAGMDAVVVTTTFPKESFRQLNNVIKYISDYRSLFPEITNGVVI